LQKKLPEKSEELNIEFKKAIRLFKKKNLRLFSEDESEDFASFVITKRLTGRKATLEQLLIDFYRRENGDSRFRSKFFKRNTRSFVEGFKPDNSFRYYGLILDLQYGLSSLNTDEFKLIYLRFFCGYKVSELSDMYEVSHFIIRSEINKILKKIKYNLIKGEKSCMN
jgi:predicted DNA-binding protein (UPF0251 family)